MNSFAEQTGLASHAARIGFAHGAQHAHQQSHNLSEHSSRPQGAAKSRIRDVWKHNLAEEMAILRELIDDYPYVAMDTEFPGIVGRPMGSFIDKSDYHYQTLRVNVDMLKIIQVGISLFNEKGETPQARTTAGDGSEPKEVITKYVATHGSLPLAWQFNFQFNINEDMANQVSIESLQQAGIDFEKLERDGIDPNTFAALMTPSGLVGDEDVKWLSFHGGYDFGYFTKCLMNETLPKDGNRFDFLMKKWFPTTYDVKYLLKFAIKLHSSGRLTPADPSASEILQKFEQKSGLEAAAELFKVKRLGPAHQAGSDSLLTGKVFFNLREKIFNGQIPLDHVGNIWGLAVNGSMNMPLSTVLASDINKENVPNSGTNAANGNSNGPTTPSTSSVGLATTPAAAQSHNTNGNGFSTNTPMTPGGGGGVFGQFSMPGGR